jgi:membrane fusion protein (multidrug efflux system)
MSRLAALIAGSSLVAGCARTVPREEAVRVVFAPVQRQDVAVRREYVGRTRAFDRVEVNARVDGFLESIDVVEGSTVKAGATLFRVDPRSYQRGLVPSRVGAWRVGALAGWCLA